MRGDPGAANERQPDELDHPFFARRGGGETLGQQLAGVSAYHIHAAQLDGRRVAPAQVELRTERLAREGLELGVERSGHPPAPIYDPAGTPRPPRLTHTDDDRRAAATPARRSTKAARPE